MLVASNSHLYHAITFSSGKSLDFIVDTGSPVSFLPISKFQALGLQVEVQQSAANINGGSGHSLPVYGQVGY